MVRKIPVATPKVRVIPFDDPNPDHPADLDPAYDLAQKIKKLISAPKARDKQIKIGPSGIGDPCEVCVANTLALMLPGRKKRPEPIKLGSWVGTAGHDFLQRLIDAQEWDGWASELKLVCGEIPGYGTVTGHTDGYDKGSATVVDYKFVGTNTFKKLKRKGMGHRYGTQRNVYGRGIELLDLPIERVMNFVIPVGMGLATVNDILVDVDYYRPEVAEAAFTRAGVIWDDWVKPGRMDELESDPDCFECSGWGMVF